jgi:hypothetical protein
MRRWRLLVAPAGLAVVVVLWPQPPSRIRITRETFERIREGMSRAEVLAILGGPPGDYRGGPTTAPQGIPFIGPQLRDGATTKDILARAAKLLDHDEPLEITPCSRVTWSGDVGELSVCFGADGTQSSYFWAVSRLPQGPLDNLLWRAKRQWHRWFPE